MRPWPEGPYSYYAACQIQEMAMSCAMHITYPGHCETFVPLVDCKDCGSMSHVSCHCILTIIIYTVLRMPITHYECSTNHETHPSYVLCEID